MHACHIVKRVRKNFNDLIASEEFIVSSSIFVGHWIDISRNRFHSVRRGEELSTGMYFHSTMAKSFVGITQS
jgi:hypothetical protein